MLFSRIFFRCNVALLRFTVTLTLISLPFLLTRLLAFHQRRRPPPLLAPSVEAIILSTFPIAWFYGFLYYTEVPSLVSVLLTVILATQHWHMSAAVVRLVAEHCFKVYLLLFPAVGCRQLSFPSNEHHMGGVCVCHQSANAFTVQTRKYAAARPARIVGWPRRVDWFPFLTCSPELSHTAR